MSNSTKSKSAVRPAEKNSGASTTLSTKLSTPKGSAPKVATYKGPTPMDMEKIESRLQTLESFKDKFEDANIFARLETLEKVKTPKSQSLDADDIIHRIEELEAQHAKWLDPGFYWNDTDSTDSESEDISVDRAALLEEEVDKLGFRLGMAEQMHRGLGRWAAKTAEFAKSLDTKIERQGEAVATLYSSLGSLVEGSSEHIAAQDRLKKDMDNLKKNVHDLKIDARRIAETVNKHDEAQRNARKGIERLNRAMKERHSV